jgi:hypothetical protein
MTTKTKNMKTTEVRKPRRAETTSPGEKTQPPGKRRTADLERRINACWLRFWNAVYPNTPPPVKSLEPSVLSPESTVRRPRSRTHGLDSLASQVPSPESAVHSSQSTVRSPKSPTQDAGRKTQDSARRHRAAADYLSRFLCAGFALALLGTGCVGPRPLKGGKAVITRKPTGVVEQTVMQGENASQPSRQDQEVVKVRTYTLPAATRVEQSPVAGSAAVVDCGPWTVDHGLTQDSRPRTRDSRGSILNSQPSTSYILSAPMPVVEREETRARTELGAAQKDTARELGAKLSSLKGIVWVGVGLFVFGLASLVYPPLKVIVASVTTSVALMLGGVALIVLPTMVVGNELLILGVVGLAVGAWFLAHRHGQLSGLVAASTASAPGSPATTAPATVPAGTSAVTPPANPAAPKA